MHWWYLLGYKGEYKGPDKIRQGATLNTHIAPSWLPQNVVTKNPSSTGPGKLFDQANEALPFVLEKNYIVLDANVCMYACMYEGNYVCMLWDEFQLMHWTDWLFGPPLIAHVLNSQCPSSEKTSKLLSCFPHFEIFFSC